MTNIKDKVQVLTRYVPKLLKASEASSLIQIGDESDYKGRIMDMVKGIIDGLIDYVNHGKKFEAYKDKYTLKDNQKVQIKDLLHIFVERIDLQKELITYLIEDDKMKSKMKYLEQLFSLNLYHRYIEFFLYADKSIPKEKYLHLLDNDESKSKVDIKYLLFLFQIYDFSDGVKICCEKMGLKQELLMYYI